MIASVVLSLALAAASPREVIVLCKPADEFAVNSAPPYPAIALVLNHLGLIPRFRDVSKGLPPEAEAARARGVLVWLDGGEAPDPEALDAWLLARTQAHQPVALLSGPAVLLERPDGSSVPRRAWGPLLEALDVAYDGLAVEDAGVPRYQPARLPDAEAPLPEHPAAFLQARALNGAKALATLELGRQHADALVAGPHGLVAMAPEVVLETNP
jgi:hypothetical protein